MKASGFDRGRVRTCNGLLSLGTKASCALLASCALDISSQAQVGVSSGDVEVEMEGVASDSAPSSCVEVALEAMLQAKSGGGIRGRMARSGDDLDFSPFDGTPGKTRATDADWFLHATFDGGTEGYRLPFRLGLFARDFELEAAARTESYSFVSLGPRIEFAPLVQLMKRESMSLAVVGMLGFGYGVATIQDQSNGAESESNAGFMDLGIGFHFDFGGGFTEIGYRRYASTYEQGDYSPGVAIGEVDATFSGIHMTLGLQF